MTEPDLASDHASEHDELERLRAEVRDLRARALTHPLIAHAQGIVQERYALPDADSAFALIRRASQQRNVRMHTLAEALVTLPRPDERAGLWFPRRTRTTEPALTFPTARATGTGTRGAVLRAVLSQTLSVLQTPMGNVQIADRARGGLRLEQHTGLSEEFVDFFAHVGAVGTSCGQAAVNVAQITVRDVETDPLFTDRAREMVLAEGSVSCHSVPLTTAGGLCVGMVSGHLDHRIEPLTAAETKALDVVGAEAGRWLAWHQRTVVVDALEHLHALGRRNGRR
ncbi:ANTAR domain-containing protein [Streptomyces sp. NPDC054829]